MRALPFADGQFDRLVSMTAIEFVADADKAFAEFARVTKKGGSIVVATLNSLSPWADRRRKSAGAGHSLFADIYFRSPDEMRALVPEGARDDAVVRTAIHFEKGAPVDRIPEIEADGSRNYSETGAFLAVEFFNP